MERSFISSPYSAKSMTSFRMLGLVQTMSYQTPLHGQVLCLIDRQAFVNAPTNRQMVQYYILLTIPSPTNPITVLFVTVAYAYTNIAYYDITCIDRQRIVFQTNSITWCRLTCDSYIIIVNTQRRFKFYCSINSKYHNTSTFSLDCFTQTPGT